jgi:hypothetical protein
MVPVSPDTFFDLAMLVIIGNALAKARRRLARPEECGLCQLRRSTRVELYEKIVVRQSSTGVPRALRIPFMNSIGTVYSSTPILYGSRNTTVALGLFSRLNNPQ